MNAEELRKLETDLMKTGLAGIAELPGAVSDFVDIIAKIVNNWQTLPNRHGEYVDKHLFLRDLLAECNATDRAEMYSAIAPKLSFPVKSLPAYEAMIRNRVNMLTSKGAMSVEGEAPAPIEVGGKKYKDAPAALATHAIATLHCQRCWKKKRFAADTPVGAMILARKAGWERLPDKWTCPGCIKKIDEGNGLVN